MTEQTKTAEEITAEITNLKKDMEASPEPDKIIIQEEITRLEKLLPETAVEVPVATEVTLSDEERKLLDEARNATGESNRGNYLDVTEIQVNNFSEEKEVNGEMVTPRPDKTFVTKNKDEAGNWITTPVAEELKGVMLKVRFRLESKYGTPEWFRSNEFSDFSFDRVTVKTGNASGNKILFSGFYADAKEQLKMTTKKGEIVKAFDLIALVYTIINGEIVKIKQKIGKDAPLFAYTQSFGKDSSFLAFETVYSLNWKEVTPTVKFWELGYSRGEKSDLGENLKTVKEINEIFASMDQKMSAPIQEKASEILDGPGVEDFSQPDAEDIKVSDIPF